MHIKQCCRLSVVNNVLQITISLATLFGVGGIIGGYTTFKLNKAKELEFKLREQKQKRYKSTLLFMDAYLKPDNITYLRRIHEALRDKNDVREWLKAEYHEMVLYASKDVVIAVRDFVNKPSDKTFVITLLAMRKDLWIKHTDLNVTQIPLKPAPKAK